MPKLFAPYPIFKHCKLEHGKKLVESGTIKITNLVEYTKDSAGKGRVDKGEGTQKDIITADFHLKDGILLRGSPGLFHRATTQYNRISGADEVIMSRNTFGSPDVRVGA